MKARLSIWSQAVLCVLALCPAAVAANPPPTQMFYVPFPEDRQLEAFSAINGNAVDPIAVFVTFSAASDGTVIYYDHWEDGYEENITNPVQSTTLVFGDGNPANGYPPGNAGDLIPAGTVFNLRNFMSTGTLQGVVDYDAGDKIATFKPISVTKTTFPAVANTLIAGCVEMFEYGLWGTAYRSPVGVDMPDTAPAGNLTNDNNLFTYASLAISAGPGGASVQIDKDNLGGFEETVVLGEGETVYRDAINVGAQIFASRPVQVVLFTGTIGSNYASRDTSLLPAYRWSNEYFAPVSTRTSPTDGTVTFLYNPGPTDITVFYDYRNSATTYATSNPGVTVPAGGNARVTLQPAAGTTHYGAYRFYTTGAAPPSFYAISCVDADALSGGNQAWDGGFTLVGKPSLTTQVLVSLGIGRDPYSSVNPAENGNPVWITTAGNGHTAERVYIDFNGDNAGAFSDPNGNRYDVSHDLLELQQMKLFDPDGDQSGMLIYTLNPNVRIAAVWAQDPASATAGAPGLDVASLVPPLREGDAGKKSNLSVDADGDGFVSAGDTLEYDIRAISNARTNIPGPFAIQDNLPADVTYLPGSTRYRFSVGGAWQAWIPIADHPSGTAFPLDGTGFSVPGTLFSGQQLQVVFLAAIDQYSDLPAGSITNTGLVEISPYGLLLPINWTDTLHGSIGNRLWNDVNGDGLQDPGESGINGVVVFADLNLNGTLDSGEPSDTTTGNGDYLLAGLLAGTYTVQVDPAGISAANVGYGPTQDPDGIATPHKAVIVLAAAEKRVDADFGYRVGASVGDRVWTDRDGDGVQEAGEPGINGVRVYLDQNNNDAYDSGEPTTLTANDGAWNIGNLTPGTYTVRLVPATLPVNALQTFDRTGALDHEATVSLIAAEHRADLDFGYRGTLSIGDLVWEDSNSDGIRTVTNSVYNIYNALIDVSGDGSGGNNDDGFIGSVQIIGGRADLSGNGSVGNEDDGSFLGVAIVNGYFDINNSGGNSNADDGTATYTVSEPGIANVRVYLDDNNNETPDVNEASALTDAAGAWSIGNMANGTYAVRVDSGSLPASYVQTYDLTSPVTDHTAAVVLAGTSRTDADFGYRNDASIGDLVWNDRNGNGIAEAGEPGIEGVIVYLDANGNNIFDQGTERSAITDVNGAYVLENLLSGSYTIRVEVSTLPQGSTQTWDLNGGLDHEASRTLTGTEDAMDVDFGYRASAAFGDYIWNDTDADGLPDPGEGGLANVRVYVDINGNSLFDNGLEPSAVTDSAGAYTIGSMVPGTYTARVDAATLPANVVLTYDPIGGMDSAATFFISANQTRTDIDFGYTSPVTIGDRVWHDIDTDGQFDAGESGLGGVGVTAFNGVTETIAATTTTAADGSWLFTTLMPGSYYIVFDPVPGYALSRANLGADSSDSDAHPATGRTQTIALGGGQSDLTLDAGYYQPGTVTGHLYVDTNGNGVQEPGEPDLANVDVLITDTHGEWRTVTSNAGGNWTALVPFGNATAAVRTDDLDFPSGYYQIEGNDPTAVVAVSNTVVNAGNDGYYRPGSLSGTVRADLNNDNIGDTPLAAVLITLKDSSGNDIDSDPNTPGVQPTSTTTAVNGTYGFANIPPATYQVVETNPAGYLSVSPDTVNPVVVVAGVNTGGVDFVDELPGSLTGTVRADTNGDGTGDALLGGVVLSLLQADGQPVLDSLSAPVTTTTAPDGTYQFAGLAPGGYQVRETQPAGYGSVSDRDGNDPDRIGDVTLIAIAPGAANAGNDFMERLQKCPDRWTDWKTKWDALLGGQTGLTQNPDGDRYDNLTEYAFCLPPHSGVRKPFCLGASTTVSGAVDGVYHRTAGGPRDVTIILQHASALTIPTVWSSLTLNAGNTTVTNNGDGSESVRLTDLESLTGLTAGTGFVRLMVALDDGTTQAATVTEAMGWVETELELCCRTYNNPFLHCATFTGTVDSVTGQTISVATSAGPFDLAASLLPGVSYYVEIVSGENEGQRFDVVSASGSMITLANDADVCAAAAPFNTSTGVPAANLAGDRLVLRRHWTLAENFPPASFGATLSQATADQIQVFAGGAYRIFWLYNDNGTPRWVDAADNILADQGQAVVPPGQGVFFNNRTVPGSVVAYGEVRENAFIRPLGAGSNLVAGGYPVDQSATGATSRKLTLGAGFFGSRDFKTADSFYLWRADRTIGATGYDSYFLLDASATFKRWVKVGDASAAVRDAELLFLKNRSVFFRASTDHHDYAVPVPWAP